MLFRSLLAAAERDSFHVTIYYEQASSTEKIFQDLQYILLKYTRSSAFLKVGARPVIFFYGRVTGRFSQDNWRDLFERLDREGLGIFAVADGFGEDLMRSFNGVHTYNPVTMPFDKVWALYLSSASRAKGMGKLFAATVLPGYDDRFVRQPGIAQDRQNGRYYRAYWDAAIDSDPQWILITSFNEWHEGSEIEPSVELGDQYLQLTRELAERWKSRR